MSTMSRSISGSTTKKFIVLATLSLHMIFTWHMDLRTKDAQ